jgi:hypothetical protein
MAEYSLEITRPDGSSKHFKFLAWDDEWDRPLKFRVEGFSNDGSHVLILLIEGNYPQSLQAGDFDLNSGHTVKSVLLDSPFTSRLSRECSATLHIIGTSPEGYIVLGTEAKDGCTRVERWQLHHNKNLHADIARNGPAKVANNRPARLSPHTTVASLEPGVPVEPR